MKLKEIVEGKEYPTIEIRVYGPDGEDMLFGYCSYLNGKLESLDGDSYGLDMDIAEYDVIRERVLEENKETLVVVKHTVWLRGDKTLIDTRDIKCVNTIDRLKKLRG